MQIVDPLHERVLKGQSTLRRSAAALFALAIYLVGGFVVTPAKAQTCQATEARHAFRSLGEVSGDRSLFVNAAEGWTFVLKKIKHGWAIRLNDSTGVDMTSVTPPFRSAVNHRNIEGWHFRNAANTGPNEGDVNAPQDLRLFFFDRSLEGDAEVDREESKGRGSLQIVDYGLADLDPGETARMVYLEYDLCLSWPKTDREIVDEANYHDLNYIDEEREAIFGCGLGLEYEINAWMKPRLLSGDFDGDDAIDEAAQIRRKSDGRRGVAVCRAGTWLEVFGMDGGRADDLPENGFAALEAWHILRDDGTLGDGSPLPANAAGDVLSLERVEKSQHIVYWSGSRFVTEKVFRLVEPDR